MMRLLKETIKKVVFHYIKPPTQFISNTYSQAGEDAIVGFLLFDKKIKNITYLDIGTNHPDWGNNTYLFYLKGSRGVCVEADKSLIAEIKKMRPEDKVLNIGVNINSNEGSSDFYVFNDPALNTFDKNEAEYRQNKGTYNILYVEKVRLKTLEEIILENFATFPDFLSIDIENLDLAVLKTINFEKYRIPVICAETCVYSENHRRPKNPEIISYMTSKGYFVYADTYVNTIFVNESWFNKIN